MSVSTNIRIKIVSLIVKFEWPTIVQRKREAEFGKNAPKKDCIIETFQRFCETGTVENGERSGRPSKLTEEKFMTILKINNKQVSTLLQRLALISRATAHEIMTEYLSLKPLFKNLMKKTSRIELVCVKL